MPTLTTYFTNVQSINQSFNYPSTSRLLVGPTTLFPSRSNTWTAGTSWSWVEFIPSRPPGAHSPPTVVNPISISANDSFKCAFDQDSGTYNPPQNTWVVPTTAGQRIFTDVLSLSDLAVKPNSSWTITGITVTIRKNGEGSPYVAGTTFARIEDALFDVNCYRTLTSLVTTSARGEKTGVIWPDVQTDYVYDLATLYSAANLQNVVFAPSTWQNILTNIRFAAIFNLSNTAKELFTWGVDSVLITFTYTLPAITPYPVNGYFQTGYQALISNPVTINPYSVKTVETVNKQVPLPGTKLAPIVSLSPYGQIRSEIIGRQTLSPGNVNIRNYPIISIEKIGRQSITSLVNLKDRSIISLEKLGQHRLNAQAYINPNGIQTLENKLNYAPVILPDDSGYPVPSIRANANIIPSPIQSIEKLGFHTLYAQAFIYPYSQKTIEKLSFNTLYAQSFIYPYAKNTEEKVGYHRLYSEAFILPYPINTVEKTGLHRLYAQSFIQPYPVTTEEKTRLHNLLYHTYIYPYSITTTEILGLHELQREVRTLSFLNQIHYPSYEMGYFDCVAISRDINNDPFYDMSFGNINTNYMFSINNMNLNYKQNSTFEKRLAGEGANPSTFKIDKRDFSFDFNIPIKIESWGDVDPSFAALYDYCIQGYKGSSSNFVGRILADDMSTAIGSTTNFTIDNIADFQGLGIGVTAYIRSDTNTESTEAVNITSISKSNKTISFSPATTFSHTPSISYLWAKSTNVETNREPSFSMFSAKEGLFSGCMVDSITLRLVPGENITASVSVKFTDLDRKYQRNFFENFNNLMANYEDKKPNYLLNASTVSVSNSQSSTSNYTFNLGDAKSSKLFHGYQEYDLRDFEIVEMTIDIKNNLEPVYSLNSKSSDDIENFNKNLQPYAYYSNGRSISGTIKYNSPMKPWLLAERLSGPSNINKSGIKFNFGPFTLEFPNVVWTPEGTNSSVESIQNKSISWSVVSDNLSYDPYPLPTGEL